MTAEQYTNRPQPDPPEDLESYIRELGLAGEIYTFAQVQKLYCWSGRRLMDWCRDNPEFVIPYGDGGFLILRRGVLSGNKKSRPRKPPRK